MSTQVSSPLSSHALVPHASSTHALRAPHRAPNPHLFRTLDHLDRPASGHAKAVPKQCLAHVQAMPPKPTAFTHAKAPSALASERAGEPSRQVTPTQRTPERTDPIVSCTINDHRTNTPKANDKAWYTPPAVLHTKSKPLNAAYGAMMAQGMLPPSQTYRIVEAPGENYYAFANQENQLFILDIENDCSLNGPIALRTHTDRPLLFADGDDTVVGINPLRRIIIGNRRVANSFAVPEMPALAPTCNINMITVHKNGNHLALVTSDKTLYLFARRRASEPWVFIDARPNCSGAWFMHGTDQLALRDGQNQLVVERLEVFDSPIRAKPVQSTAPGTCLAVNPRRGLVVMHYPAGGALKTPEFSLECLADVDLRPRPRHRIRNLVSTTKLNEKNPHSVTFRFSADGRRLLVAQNKVWCIDDVGKTNTIHRIKDEGKGSAHARPVLRRLVRFSSKGDEVSFIENKVQRDYTFEVQARQPAEVAEALTMAAPAQTSAPHVHALSPTSANAHAQPIAPTPPVFRAKTVPTLSWTQRVAIPFVGMYCWVGQKMGLLTQCITLALTAWTRSVIAVRNLTT